MQEAQATQAQAAVQIQARRDQGRDQIKAVNMRFQDIQYEVPDSATSTYGTVLGSKRS